MVRTADGWREDPRAVVGARRLEPRARATMRGSLYLPSSAPMGRAGNPASRHTRATALAAALLFGLALVTH